MKRTLLVLVTGCALFVTGVARAADPKPDCSAQKTAVDDAVKASKVKADLSSCADKKGKEKTECEKPLKDKAKEDTKAAKDTVKTAKTALGCCQNPKKKGCGA